LRSETPHTQSDKALRTCVASREVLAQDELIRWFVGPDGTHWPDWTGKSRGRFGKGRYTQRTLQMVQQAIQRKQLTGNKEILVQRAIDSANRAFLDRLGLACRANALAIGQAAVRDVLRQGWGKGVLIYAQDAGAAGVERVHDRVLQRGTLVVEVSDGERIGQALGRQYVSMLWCQDSAFAHTLWAWTPAMATHQSIVKSVRFPTVNKISLEAPSPKD